MKICFVAPFPPRHDGIAEFNSDLIDGILKNKQIDYFGVAINKGNEYLKNFYRKDVSFQIRKDMLEDYRKAAEYINSSDATVVCLHLEYALFGGFDGKYIIELIKKLRKPLVVVVHGSPINSYSRRKLTRKKFFQQIAPYVHTFITINPLQKQTLERWGLKNNIVNILHGAPDAIEQYSREESRKQRNLQENKLIIFNFGLLHPKKGLEFLLEGFRQFVSTQKNAQLILAGETLSTSSNTNYQDVLKKYIREHNFEKDVQIIPRFLEKEELYRYLRTADIVVLPYMKRDLVSSGPLSFATLADTFIITTPFPYAKVLLDPTEAYFVRYQHANDIAQGFHFFSTHRKTTVPKMLDTLQRKGSEIRWSNQAKKYLRIFSSAEKYR